MYSLIYLFIISFLIRIYLSYIYIFNHFSFLFIIYLFVNIYIYMTYILNSLFKCVLCKSCVIVTGNKKIKRKIQCQTFPPCRAMGDEYTSSAAMCSFERRQLHTRGFVNA